MITLSMMNQYAMDNDIGDDTDIFLILSQMQLEYGNTTGRMVNEASPTPPATRMDLNKVEYSTQDVLDLFST